MESLASPDLVVLATRIVVTALFAGVFAFLYREARNIYFSYWAVSWGLLGAGLLFHFASVVTGRAVLLLPYGLLELAFAGSLLFAGSSAAGKFDIRLPAIAALLPVLAGAGYLAGLWSDRKGFYALHNLLLAGIYGWNFLAARRHWRSSRGTGRKLFSVSLVASSLISVHDTLLYSSSRIVPDAPIPGHLRYGDLYDLVLQTLLAFSALMMWMEAQQAQLVETNTELARSRQELARHSRIDPLTGLMNRAALDEIAGEPALGVVAVLDLDNFKDVNDALGHLTGDEVLANVGNLIRASVRKQDQAWRWGGDEFVIWFREGTRESAEERLRALEERLVKFRLRGKGVLPINVSWGLAESVGSSLRGAIEEADRRMYLKKREKASPSKFFAG